MATAAEETQLKYLENLAKGYQGRIQKGETRLEARLRHTLGEIDKLKIKMAVAKPKTLQQALADTPRVYRRKGCCG